MNISAHGRWGGHSRLTPGFGPATVGQASACAGLQPRRRPRRFQPARKLKLAPQICCALLATLAPAQEPITGNLADLLTAYEPAARDAARKLRITTAAQWEANRGHIRRRVLDIMGDFPASGPLHPRVLSEEDTGTYTLRKVQYADEVGRPIPAWLLVPKGAGPFPAVLAAHQTDEGAKDSVIGRAGPPHVHYGRELAGRGFVVLAPDSITAGERILEGAKRYETARFDAAHPRWSAMGKMCADHRRGLDYLAGLPFVDPRRVAAIGHSLGGYNSYFLGAFDERVRAVVVSCGFTPMGRATRPFAWSRTSWFVHFPRLSPYLRAGILPFDFHEVMALIAPRPLFNYSGSRDSIFPDADAIREAGAQIAAVYELLGARGRLVFRVGDGPHDFPEPVRKEAYQWLAKQLAP